MANESKSDGQGDERASFKIEFEVDSYEVFIDENILHTFGPDNPLPKVRIPRIMMPEDETPPESPVS